MEARYYHARTATGRSAEHAIRSDDGPPREGLTLCGMPARSTPVPWTPRAPDACRRCARVWASERAALDSLGD